MRISFPRFWSFVVVLLFVTTALPGLATAAGQTMVRVVPEETNAPLVNPCAGWGIWAGPRDWGFKNFSVADNTTAYPDDAPLFSWLMLDWNWSDLEPREGEINWKDFDTVVQYWAARHKQIFVRLWVTDDAGWNGDPGTNPIPDWLWNKGMHHREYKGNGGVTKWELDYADPTYKEIFLPALQKLLDSFAERYDKPGTPVIFLQVMGYGHWADWGTWYSHYPWPSAHAQHEVLSELMKLYIRIFKHIRLFEMGSGDWNPDWDTSLQDRLYRKALDVAVDHGFGLIWTGFIDGLSSWDRDEMEQYWQTLPIIAEDDWDYLEIKDQKIHGTLDENLDGMLDYHATFAHYYVRSTTYSRAMSDDRAHFERGLRSGGLGYRLVPTSLSWPSELPAGNLLVFRQTWVNRNVGRLYVQHPLKLYLTDSQGAEKFSAVDTSFDERSWVRGKDYSLISVFNLKLEGSMIGGVGPRRKNLPPGMYDVRIALVDAEGKPRIRLGIEGADSELRYKVGEIRILPPEKVTGCDEAYCP
jgi:hypothetical protein